MLSIYTQLSVIESYLFLHRIRPTCILHFTVTHQVARVKSAKNKTNEQEADEKKTRRFEKNTNEKATS